MKLKQKQFLKGSREFEIDGDTLFVHIKSFLKEEKLTVDLTLLNREPVVEGSEMIFYSDFKGRPLLSLLVNNPDTQTFNTFVDALKNNIGGQETVDTGLEVDKKAETETTSEEVPEADIADDIREEGMNRNFYEAPPEFAEHNTSVENPFKPVNPLRVEEDIAALKAFVEDIPELITSLEELMAEPDNEAIYEKMLSNFNELGFKQGAVLTYAPYIKVLTSNSIAVLERLGSKSYKGVKGK